MDGERRTWKKWPIFSRCAIRDVAPLRLRIRVWTNCKLNYILISRALIWFHITAKKDKLRVLARRPDTWLDYEVVSAFELFKGLPSLSILFFKLSFHKYLNKISHNLVSSSTFSGALSIYVALTIIVFDATLDDRFGNFTCEIKH